MSDPANYRPITLLSCLDKLVTTILNNRLLKYVEDNDIISNYQAGFRQYHSTVDNICVLNQLIEHMFSMKNKFCAFIDLKGAFDSINGNMLWLKLGHFSISGNFFNILKSMHEYAKSCVRVNGSISDYFNSCIGVRQVESLSPLLFSFFLSMICMHVILTVHLLTVF